MNLVLLAAEADGDDRVGATVFDELESPEPVAVATGSVPVATGSVPAATGSVPVATGSVPAGSGDVAGPDSGQGRPVESGDPELEHDDRRTS